MESDENPFSFPNLKETISKIKSDFTLEKQYDSLLFYDLISAKDKDRLFLENLLASPTEDFYSCLSVKESKGIACFLGLIIADALGNINDGLPFDASRNSIVSLLSFSELTRLPLGLYSDDGAMALCIADSILANDYNYDPLDMKHRFLLWWYEGLNNGKAPLKAGKEEYRAKNPLSYYSIGIGTTIWCSLLSFLRNSSEPHVSSKDSIMPRKSDGNGSIMRLAPIVLAFHNDTTKMTEISRDQSFLTHFGEEAAECCQFLANFLAILINEDIPCFSNFDMKKQFFLNVSKRAQIQGNITLESLICLSESRQEELLCEDEDNEVDEDRNWDWAAENFQYSLTRIKKNPNCIGVYCMDCLAMALHITLYSNDLKEAFLKVVNSGGDSDSVGAVVGQIAGAFYGIGEFILKEYAVVRRWDENKTILRAYKLMNQNKKNSEKL